MNPLDQAVEAVVRALDFTDAAIAQRKAFLEFTDDDTARLKALHAALRDLEPDFVNAFYSHLLTFEETRRFISDPQSLDRLKRTQAAYFDSLTAGDYGPDYILNRLRVGIVHQRIGLTTQWYLGAYSKYLAGLLPEIWQRLGPDPEAFVATCQALNKIVLLDMGLAIDTYIHADRQTILALKEYAEMVFASIPDGLLVLSADLAILSANRAFLEQFGLTAQTIRGRHLMEVIAAEGLRERALEVLASGAAQHDMPFSMGAAESGARKPVRLTLTGIHLAEEEEEEEEEAAAARLLLIVEDVSEEERLREQAQAHETRYRSLFNNMLEGFAYCRMLFENDRPRDFVYVEVNPAFEQLTGLKNVVGKKVTEVIPGIRESHPELFEAYGRVALTGQPERFELYFKPLESWLSIAVYSTEVGYFIAVFDNITERKRAEQILRDYTARLQTVSRKLLEVQEDERRRLARELHDQVGQVLTALKVNLQVIERQPAAAPVALRIEECAQIADAALQQVRTLMLDLRPPQLDELGLAAALRTHAERVVTPANLALHFSAPAVPPKMPPAIEIVCFRIMQEALTNILRHAGATNVWIELAAADDGLELTVRDDGKGFDLAEAHQRATRGGSMGLLSMDERAALADGRVEISTAPGAGTTVRAMFPLQAAQSTGDTA